MRSIRSAMGNGSAAVLLASGTLSGDLSGAFAGNTSIGNGLNGIQLSGVIVGGTTTLARALTDFPYVTAGRLNVPAGASLALAAGTAFKLAGGPNGYVPVDGAL